ncbi:MAG: cob(I)yrinic acid a,c-diamide adenosyltransferase [Thermoplasmatota archaeon]
MNKGLIQVYTGDGKGKTTAALGLAVRAAGRGIKVLIIQFMKGRSTGERKVIKETPNIQIENYGTSEFIKKEEIKEKDKLEIKKGFERAIEAIEIEDLDILILDEINVVLDLELLNLEDFINFLKKYGDKDLEIVLTGRNAPQEILELAALVTEMKCIKHPFEKGIGPRKGIEY